MLVNDEIILNASYRASLCQNNKKKKCLGLFPILQKKKKNARIIGVTCKL